MKRAYGLLVVALVAGNLSLPAAAELKDLGEFPARETAKELEVVTYHYWKDGREIIAEATGKGGTPMATLRVSWPGDMTARIHLTTVADDRDVEVVWHTETGKTEFLDNRSGKRAVISFNKGEQRFELTGPAETLEEFTAKESRVLGFALTGYADVLGNLNLGPRIAPLPEESGPAAQGSRGAPELCEWFMCNGQQVVANDFGLTPTRCCTGARQIADADCFLFGGGECASCCTYSNCSYLCAVPGLTALCSCTIVGTSCGASVFEPCEEWPPECT